MLESPLFANPHILKDDALTKRTLWALILVFVAIWFGQLDYRKLVKPDEGRYAEISREMAASGDWVTPRLNGLKYFEKPPMQYWATAVAYHVAGEHEWTARLWTALTGFLGIVAAAYAGSVLFGRRAGLLAALVLGSSFYYLALGHINTLDMGVSFFLELALVGFLMAHRDGASANTQRNWMWLTWAAMAGAMLSKGLIGLVLPGAALVLYVLATRQFRLLLGMRWLSGLLIFAALTLPWFALVSARNPEFLQFFFIHEHFQRFSTDAARRLAPWWIFVPILAIGITPWLTWLPQSLIASMRKLPTERFRPQLLLLIWSVFIFVFFSTSKSKLPAYILPIFPAVAILLGDYLSRVEAASLRRHAALLLAAAIVVAAIFAVAPHFANYGSEATPRAMIDAYIQWGRVAALAGVAGFAVAYLLARSAKVLPAFVAMGFASVIATSLFLNGHNALARSNSAFFLAQDIKPHLKPGVPFYSVKMYDQTLPFYIKRTLTLVDYRDELSLGIDQQPELAVATLREFTDAWQHQPEALALMSTETYADLAKNQQLTMRVIASDTRRVVVSKP